MRRVAHHAAADGVDRFIAVRKAAIVEALLEDGALADAAARDQSGRVCDVLAAVLHYDYFAQRLIPAEKCEAMASSE